MSKIEKRPSIFGPISEYPGNFIRGFILFSIFTLLLNVIAANLFNNLKSLTDIFSNLISIVLLLILVMPLFDLFILVFAQASLNNKRIGFLDFLGYAKSKYLPLLAANGILIIILISLLFLSSCLTPFILLFALPFSLWFIPYIFSSNKEIKIIESIKYSIQICVKHIFFSLACLVILIILNIIISISLDVIIKDKLISSSVSSILYFFIIYLAMYEILRILKDEESKPKENTESKPKKEDDVAHQIKREEEILQEIEGRGRLF